jgi:DNA-binding NarL/FixJ family response regulator
MSKIKVLIVDDHAVVVRGLSFYLRTLERFEVVGEAYSGREAIDKAERLQPDIILMDLVMPEMNGIEATKAIKEKCPHIKVLVLTSMDDQEYILPAMRAGATGYLLKDTQPEQLAEAIRAAHSGHIQLHPKISEQLMNSYGSVQPLEKKATVAPKEFGELTAREIEVLMLITRGMSNKEIAADLHITEKTVKTHVSHILSKLEVADRTQAAILAMKKGLVQE